LHQPKLAGINRESVCPGSFLLRVDAALKADLGRDQSGGVAVTLLAWGADVHRLWDFLGMKNPG
jgi:hypothetical protein